MTKSTKFSRTGKTLNFSTLVPYGNVEETLSKLGARSAFSQRSPGRPLSPAGRLREQGRQDAALELVKRLNGMGSTPEEIAEVLGMRYGGPIPVDVVQKYVETYL